MPNFRRFLSRRWLLAGFGLGGLSFGLAMLHLYPQRTLFGPTIRGKPWYVRNNVVLGTLGMVKEFW